MVTVTIKNIRDTVFEDLEKVLTYSYFKLLNNYLQEIGLSCFTIPANIICDCKGDAVIRNQSKSIL